MGRRIVILAFLAFFFLPNWCASPAISKVYKFENQSKLAYVQDFLAKATLEEKIGQLFMADAYSCRGKKHFAYLQKLVTDYKIGGFIFLKGGPGRQRNMVDSLQKLSKTKLLIGMDAEWGPGMHLDSVPIYPRQMTLGAINDPILIEKMGADIAKKLQSLGANLSFSPVVDINSNPKNPIIGNRSFGDKLDRVSALSIAYMKGLQQGGIIANAKHFPGHGHVTKDSHYSLPLISKSFEELSAKELIPFQKLIDQGIASVMVGHLQVPKIDGKQNQSASLSNVFINDILRKKMKFQGLIFTDALNMRAVTRYHKPGELEVKALLAGNDVLIFSENIPEGIKAIKKAILAGKITEAELNEHVSRILSYKFELENVPNTYLNRVGITQLLSNTEKQNNDRNSEWLIKELYIKAAVLQANKQGQIPIQSQASNIIGIAINTPKKNVFLKQLQANGLKELFSISGGNLENQTKRLLPLKNKTIVAGVFNINKGISGKVRLNESYVTLLKQLSKNNKVIVVLFGSPYALNRFQGFETVLLMHEDNFYTQTIAPQIVFGKEKATGTLPITLN